MSILDIIHKAKSAGPSNPSNPLVSSVVSSVPSNVIDLSGLDFAEKTPSKPDFDLSFDDFAKPKKIVAFETNARKTLIRFLNTTPEGVEFTFYVPAGRAGHHVNTMRVVLAKLKQENPGKLKNFKLLHRDTRTEGAADIVRIMRVPLGSGLHRPSAYAELLQLLSVEGNEK